jgi:hypothetical protein
MKMVPPPPQQHTNDSSPMKEILKNITNNAGKSPRRGKRDREMRVCDVSLDHQLERQQKTDLEKRQRITQPRGYDIEWELSTTTVVYASKEEALEAIRFKQEMRRKKKEREVQEEVSKKQQAIGRADGRGYQFQTPSLVAPSVESSESSLQMSNESSIPNNDNPTVDMVNPMANDSDSENEFEWQPDNADTLKAKVGVILLPHILCPCSFSHSTSRSFSDASFNATGWR